MTPKLHGMDGRPAQALPPSQAIYLWLMPALLSLILLPIFGTSDMGAWLSWAEIALDLGLLDGYTAVEFEHPPGTLILLYLALFLGKLVWPSSSYYGLKFMLMVAVWLSTWQVWRWSRNHAVSLLAFAGFFYSAIALSYLDIFFTPFIIACCYFLQRQRLIWALLAYAVACYIKYPVLMLGPIIAVYLLKNYTWRELLYPVSITALAFIAACLPFGMEPWQCLMRAFGHDTLSSNALNFN